MHFFLNQRGQNGEKEEEKKKIDRSFLCSFFAFWVMETLPFLTGDVWENKGSENIDFES